MDGYSQALFTAEQACRRFLLSRHVFPKSDRVKKCFVNMCQHSDYIWGIFGNKVLGTKYLRAYVPVYITICTYSTVRSVHMEHTVHILHIVYIYTVRSVHTVPYRTVQ